MTSGVSRLIVDVSDQEATDLSWLTLSVDGVALAPIALDAAIGGVDLATILNAHSAFSAAGLTATWQADQLSIEHPDAAVVLSDLSLQAGVAENLLAGREYSYVTVSLPADPYTIHSFLIKVDGVSVSGSLSAGVDTLEGLVSALNENGDFSSDGLTASISEDAQQLLLTHAGFANLIEVQLFADTDSTEVVPLSVEFFAGDPTYVDIPLAQVDGQLAWQYPIRTALSSFGISVDGVAIDPIDLSAVDSVQELINQLNGRDVYLVNEDPTQIDVTDLYRQTIWLNQAVDAFQVYTPGQGDFAGRLDLQNGVIVITQADGEVLAAEEHITMGTSQAAFEALLAGTGGAANELTVSTALLASRDHFRITNPVGIDQVGPASAGKIMCLELNMPRRP